jgi:hypothetical protein
MNAIKARPVSEFKQEPRAAGMRDQHSTARAAVGSATCTQEVAFCWDIWLATVKSIERKKRPKISKSSYMATHAKLLRLCEAGDSGKIGTPESVQPIHVSMNYLVSPWVTLESLEQAERSILRNLICQCRDVDKLVHPYRIRLDSRMFYVALLIVAIGAGLLAVFEYEMVMQFLRSSVDMFRRRIAFAFISITPSHWLSGLAVLVVFVGAWMTRDMRSY